MKVKVLQILNSHIYVCYGGEQHIGIDERYDFFFCNMHMDGCLCYVSMLHVPFVAVCFAAQLLLSELCWMNQMQLANGWVRSFVCWFVFTASEVRMNLRMYVWFVPTLFYFFLRDGAVRSIPSGVLRREVLCVETRTPKDDDTLATTRRRK